MMVYAAAALGANPKKGRSLIATRISFVSDAEAIGLAVRAVEEDGYELDGYHVWWEELPTSGTEAGTGETEGLDPKDYGPTSEAGDAK